MGDRPPWQKERTQLCITLYRLATKCKCFNYFHVNFLLCISGPSRDCVDSNFAIEATPLKLNETENSKDRFVANKINENATSTKILDHEPAQKLPVNTVDESNVQENTKTDKTVKSNTEILDESAANTDKLLLLPSVANSHAQDSNCSNDGANISIHDNSTGFTGEGKAAASHSFPENCNQGSMLTISIPAVNNSGNDKNPADCTSNMAMEIDPPEDAVTMDVGSIVNVSDNSNVIDLKESEKEKCTEVTLQNKTLPVNKDVLVYTQSAVQDSNLPNTVPSIVRVNTPIIVQDNSLPNMVVATVPVNTSSIPVTVPHAVSVNTPNALQDVNFSNTVPSSVLINTPSVVQAPNLPSTIPSSGNQPAPTVIPAVLSNQPNAVLEMPLPSIPAYLVSSLAPDGTVVSSLYRFVINAPLPYNTPPVDGMCLPAAAPPTVNFSSPLIVTSAAAPPTANPSSSLIVTSAPSSTMPLMNVENLHDSMPTINVENLQSSDCGNVTNVSTPKGIYFFICLFCLCNFTYDGSIYLGFFSPSLPSFPPPSV